MAERLWALGMEPVLLPAIETVAPTSFAALDEALAQLRRFDWLLFTSANAVEAVAARLGQGRSPRPSRPRIAAIGPATSRALEALGWTVDLVPEQAVNESLLAALLPFVRSEHGSPARFLFPRAEEARELLPEGLRDAGAEVTVAAAYRTVLPAASLERVRQMAVDPAQDVDAMTFTSASTVRNVVQLYKAAGVAIPERAVRVSIGPITSQTLREQGLPPHAEAAEATVAALAEAVRRVLSTGRGNSGD